MVVALVGSNSFALKKRLNELIDGFVSKSGELALERFDGEEAEAKAVKDAISNVPFLANAKMVIVRNGQANSEFAEQIEQIISSIPKWCDLILYEPQIDKRSSYFKVLKDHRLVEEFTELDSRGLAKWLTAEAKKGGGELNFGDANYLIERVGTDQNLLYNELQKLLTYDKQISRQNIELLTEPTPQSRIFDLLDAAFSNKKAKALKLYDEQRAQKVEPKQILAMLIWQLQVLALAKYGQNPRQTAKDSGISDYPLRKAAGLAAQLTEADLQRMIDEAYEMELNSKTKTYDLDEALKTYIVSL